MHSFTTFLSLLIFSLISLIPFNAAASHLGNRVGNIHRRVEASLGSGEEASLLNSTGKYVAELQQEDLTKRGDSARFTWFVTGLGACGGVNTDSDFIVAINQPQWDGGSHCYETVTLTFNGKSAQAQIVDECMECPPNALDLSIGLFRFLAGPSVDQVTGEWSFGSGTEAASTAKPAEHSTSVIKTSSTHAPPQTSTKETRTSTSVISTTSSVTPTSTTTRSTASTTLTSSREITQSTQSTSSSPSSTTSTSSIPTVADYFSAANEFLFNLGNIVMQAPAAATRG
jgi:hypothetical protein